MKLSRNVLVGSLATAGMVLGAIAPALTAQAATTSGNVNATDGTVTPTTDLDKGVSAGQLGKGNLAIAYTNDDNSVTGKATASSNASVDVVTGILVLDQVPDFNFGAAASGSVKGLVDNSKGSQTNTSTENDQGTAPIDGNSQGNLQVIESRSGDALSGFTVSASLGEFTNASGTAVDGDSTNTAIPAFQLNLKPADMTLNGADYLNGKVPFQTESANMVAKDATAKPVMTVAKGQSGYTTGTYAAALNTSDLVSLNVPAGIGSGQSVQSLNSTITWTLAATPKATV